MVLEFGYLVSFDFIREFIRLKKEFEKTENKDGIHFWNNLWKESKQRTQGLELAENAVMYLDNLKKYKHPSNVTVFREWISGFDLNRDFSKEKRKEMVDILGMKV